MEKRRKPGLKRTIIAVMLFSFVFSGVFGAVFTLTSAPARAQFAVSDPVVGTNTLVSRVQQVQQKVTDKILTTLVNTAALALLNAGNYFLQKIAYDMANYIASGGKGQAPLFHTSSLGSYMKSTLLDAAGEALGTISKEGGFEALGINLCSPPNPKISLNIKMSFRLTLPSLVGGPVGNAPKPKCSWRDISNNWDSFSSQPSMDVLNSVGVMFAPGQSTLGTASAFNAYALNKMAEKQAQQAMDRLFNAGYKAVSTPIAGKIMTPAQNVSAEMQRSNRQAAEQGQQQSMMITAAAFSKGALGIFPAAAQTFVNTLGQQLMKNLMNKGLIALSQLLSLNEGTTDLYNEEAAAPPAGGGVKAAALANAELLTPRIVSTTNFDELTEFSTCPSDVKTINNCVMDQPFFNAVSQGSYGGAGLTVRQAIEQGMLHGDWRLIPATSSKNSDRNCYLDSYCASNLAKLRKARILPVGWELAANSAFNGAARPVTLKEAMDHFNDCPVRADGSFDASKLPDSNHPWCHLIDPEWVLKYPKATCLQQVPGPVLQNSQASTRAPVCVDTSNCLSEDIRGNCVGGYGYCLREKNGWKFDAQTCPAQYATCQAVSDAAGAQKGFLMNTVDVAKCNADNAGCRAYSTSKNLVPDSGFEDLLIDGNGRYYASGWTYTPTGARVIVDASRSLEGRASMVLEAGENTVAEIPAILPGAQYSLAASAVADLPVANSAYKAYGDIKFHARKTCRDLGADGKPVYCSQDSDCSGRNGDSCQIGPVTLGVCLSTTDAGGTQKPCFKDSDCGSGDSCRVDAMSGDCGIDQVRGVVRFTIPATNLGYQQGGCKVTAPSNAVSAEFELGSDLPPVNGLSNHVSFDDISVSGPAYSAAPLDSLFLDSKALACDGNDAGCADMVKMKGALLNMVRNSGFEGAGPVGQNAQTAAYWTGTDEDGVYNYNKYDGFEGVSSVFLHSEPIYQEIDRIIPDAAYVVSAYSKKSGSGVDPTGTLSVALFDGTGVSIAPAMSDCLASDGVTNRAELAIGADYSRTSCSFLTPSNAVRARVSLIRSNNPAAANLEVDAVQLELGSVASDYHEGYSADAEHVFIKKSPEWMHCNGSPLDPPECAGFAPSCRREEVGCNLYTPADGGTPIPAVTTDSDVCPAECVGYQTFREEPSNFFDSAFPKFFIPDTAKACSSDVNGCEEFTNLEALARGGESRETYSFLRLCDKPDANTATYYTWEGSDTSGYQLRVWQLMKSNYGGAAIHADSDPTSGVAPCTVLSYDPLTGLPRCNDSGNNDKVAFCSKVEMAFNPDCREFYDTDGNIHYRLLSKTVLSTDECTEYRQTDADQASCAGHGGKWVQNECRYFAYKPGNTACKADAVGCRGYAGNASRNVHLVVNEDFEDGTAAGWCKSPASAANCQSSDVANSNESVTAGGHSLKSLVGSVSRDVSGVVAKGRPYILTFWAKGSGDLSAQFASAKAGSTPTDFIGSVPLSTDWKSYTIGPVSLVEEPVVDAVDKYKDEMLIITDTGSTALPPAPQFYIDNVVLMEATDDLYLIKDSWKTPQVCDQTPGGDPAPQYMLGCQAYTDKDAVQSNLKSFNNICRPEVIGCEALYDSRNTASPFPETHKAACLLSGECGSTTAAGADTTLAAGALTCPCAANGKTVCEVPNGATSCRYDDQTDAGAKLTTTAGGHISADGDTARVAADSILYLVDDPKYRCSQENAGCAEFGDKALNPDGDVVTGWTQKFFKNDPSTYGQSLCTLSELYCRAWTKQEDGSPLYFKDPGTHACEYKTGVTIGGFSFDGWFKTGTELPCYPDYLQGGARYGLWKNDDSRWQKWVGICPQNFSMCKEFDDPTDKSLANPEGRPYYAIMNDQLDTTSCQGQVSLTTAPPGATEASSCVLFRRSDDVTLKYSATRTYSYSDIKNGALVGPVSAAAQSEPCVLSASCANTSGCSCRSSSGFTFCTVRYGQDRCTPTNDSNIILKVKRDRDCAQWLTCRTNEVLFDQTSGNFKNVCTAYDVCDRFEKTGDSTICTDYVQQPSDQNVLSAGPYEARDTGFSGQEYSGYSVPNTYPVQSLSTVNISPVLAKPDYRLVYAYPPVTSPAMLNCPPGSYGAPCGPANNLGNRGRCMGPNDGPSQLQCVYPIDGSTSWGNDAATRSVQPDLAADLLANVSSEKPYPKPSCRAYPQDGSPFPADVADPSGWDTKNSGMNNGNPVFLGASPAFDGANVCQRRLINGVMSSSCECSYLQADYASKKHFFSIDDPDLPSGYCEGGAYEGYECDPFASGVRTPSNLSCCQSVPETTPGTTAPSTLGHCDDGAICNRLTKVERVVGYQGQCLEKDLSTPVNNRSDQFACLTWRPVGIIGGGIDTFNLTQSAGYVAQPDRRFYCAGSKGPWALELRLAPSPRNLYSRYNVGHCWGGGANCDRDSDCNSAPNTCKTNGRCTYGNAVCGSDGDCQKNYCDGYGRLITEFMSNNVSGPDGTSDQVDPSLISVFTNVPAVAGHSAGPVDGAGDSNSAYWDYQYVDNWDQPTLDYFGTGVMSDPVTEANSRHLSCGDDVNQGKWCLWPGTSTYNYAENYFSVTSKPIGIFGCYEFGNKSTFKNTYIQYPYVGPAIYADQLHSIDLFVNYELERYQTSAVNQFQSFSGTDGYHFACDDEGGRHAVKKGLYSGDPTDTKDDSPHFSGPAGYCYRGYDRNTTTGGGEGVIGPYNFCYADTGFGTQIFDRIGEGLNPYNSWSITSRSGSVGAQFSAIFDASNRLSYFKVAAQGGTYASFAIQALRFDFKPGCQYVARVDQPGQLGLTTAYTDLVNSQRNFLLEAQGVNRTSSEQSCKPWGSIGSITGDPAVSPMWTYVVPNQEYDSVPKVYGADVFDASGNVIHRKGEAVLDSNGFQVYTNVKRINQCLNDSFTRGSVFGYANVNPTTTPERVSNATTIQRLFRKIYGFFGYLEMGNKVPVHRGVAAGPLYTPYGIGGPGTQDDLTNVTSPSLLYINGSDPVAGTQFIAPVAPMVAAPKIASATATSFTLDSVNNISVNGRSKDILTAQGGVFKAIVKFFAWAGHNQMPIRTRVVDWSDYRIGSTPVEPPAAGWFKNRKPYCSDSAEDQGAVNECSGYPGLTCRTDTDCPLRSSCGNALIGTCSDGKRIGENCRSDSDCQPCDPADPTTCPSGATTEPDPASPPQCMSRNHFGNTPGACAAEPFTFEHVYTCTEADLNNLPDCGSGNPAFWRDPSILADNPPCRRDINCSGDAQDPYCHATKGTCVYDPAVQVTDNWGWCNCTGANCYYGNGDYGQDGSSTSCNQGAWPIPDFSTTNRPWTYYQGEIRVMSQ